MYQYVHNLKSCLDGSKSSILQRHRENILFLKFLGKTITMVCLLASDDDDMPRVVRVEGEGWLCLGDSKYRYLFFAIIR